MEEESRGGPTVEKIQVLELAEDTENNISQKPVVTSAMATGAQPYWSVAACSGKIRLPKHMIVTMTEANTPNARLEEQVREEDRADAKEYRADVVLGETRMARQVH